MFTIFQPCEFYVCHILLNKGFILAIHVSFIFNIKIKYGTISNETTFHMKCNDIEVCLLYGRVVVALTHSPFPFSILFPKLVAIDHITAFMPRCHILNNSKVKTKGLMYVKQR